MVLLELAPRLLAAPPLRPRRDLALIPLAALPFATDRSGEARLIDDLLARWWLTPMSSAISSTRTVRRLTIPPIIPPQADEASSIRRCPPCTFWKVTGVTRRYSAQQLWSSSQGAAIGATRVPLSGQGHLVEVKRLPEPFTG